jgi:threonine/homoserine/homoserine lactone efflux protein
MLLAVIFSSVGLGYSIYGLRQHRGAALLAGVGLMMYPYLVHGALVMLGLGVLLAAVPFWFEF